MPSKIVRPTVKVPPKGITSDAAWKAARAKAGIK
jgi:hypothetical protein